MSEQARRLDDGRTDAGTFLLRLVLVLAAVVAFVLLFKRATAPERQIQALLDEETKALNRSDWEAFGALQDPQDPGFRRHQKTQFDSLQMARSRNEAWAMSPQPTLHVVEVSRREDRAWALVMEDVDGDPQTGPVRIEFFRREYGQWLHTGPAPDHWGPEQESRTEHVTWRYREADAELVARLAAMAENLIEQVCDDTGLELETNALIVNVCYSLDCGYVIYPLNEVLDLPTPLLFGFDEANLQYLLGHVLVDDLFGRATELEEGVPGLSSPLLSGIESWEVVQVVGEVPGWHPPDILKQTVASDTLLGLYELSEPGIEGETAMLRHDQAYTLVDYIVARYGRQVLPALVRAAGRRVGVAETLQEVLGPDLDLAAFEADWLEYVRERYGE